MVTAVFCDDPGQLEAVEAESGDSQLVTLTPRTWWVAQTRGMRFQTLEDLYDEGALCARRNQVAEQQREWSAWVDRTLCERIPPFGERMFRPTEIWFKWIKMLLDPLVMLAFSLDEALRRLQPREIVLAPRPSEFDWNRFFRISPHGDRVVKPRFLPAHVLPLLAAKRGVPCRAMPSPADPASAAGLPSTRTRVKRAVPWWLVDRVNLYRGLPWWRAIALWGEGRLARGPRVLVIRSGYDIDALTREAIRHGWRPEFWSEAIRRGTLSARDEEQCRQVRQQCTTLWPELASAQPFRQVFHTSGIDVFPLVRQGMERFFCDVVPETFRTAVRARVALAAGSHRAVLTNSGHSAPAVLQAAKHAGVPVVIYQHGGFGGTCEHLFWDFEVLKADGMLLYGEGVRQYLESRMTRHAARGGELRVAGSARLFDLFSRSDVVDAMRLRAELLRGRSADRLLVYTAPITDGYCRLLAGESYPETSNVRFIARLFDLMREFPRTHLVVKAYKDQDIRLLREMLDAKQVANCRIETEIPLPKLMLASDAIAIGFPSTPLLEAVLTSKPVAVYIDSKALHPIATALDLLRRRARVAESDDAFLREIRRLLTGVPHADIDLHDRAYAEAHVFSSTVHPAVRAWAHVSELAESHRSA